MARVRGLTMTGAGVTALACALLATGCASPKPPVAKPPGVVVPGVLGAGGSSGPGTASGAPAAGGNSGNGGPGSTVKAGTNGTVLLGGWAPGGPRNPAAAGALAYFKWLNARGGVYGRAISYRVLDDRNSARLQPSLVHQLVQGDAVFAIFAAQGIQASAVTSYLDTASVPDMFANWTCDCLQAPTGMNQVYGWPLTSNREGQILGAYIAQHYPGQKIALAYAPDSTGRDGLGGFLKTASGIKIVARTAVTGPSGDAPAVTAARAAKAQVLVAFTMPGAATIGLNTAMTASHWHVPLVAAGSGTGLGLPDGAVTDGFLPSTAAPAGSAARTWITLFSKIRAKYLHGIPLSTSVISGMAAAYQVAAAMFRAGPSLTRQNLLTALNGLQPGPLAGPLSYTAADHGGATSAYIGIVRTGILTPTDVVLIIRGTHPQVTTYARPWQKAPANGIPAH